MLPRLAEIRGRVVSVSFAPSRDSVRIRTDKSDSWTCLAEPALIEKAFRIRQDVIFAMILERHDLKRLLSIRAEGEEVKEMMPEERTERMLDRWGELLQRLA